MVFDGTFFWRCCESFKFVREVEEGAAQQDAAEVLSKQLGEKKKRPNHMDACWLLQGSPKKDKMKQKAHPERQDRKQTEQMIRERR